MIEKVIETTELPRAVYILKEINKGLIQIQTETFLLLLKVPQLLLCEMGPLLEI